MNPKPTCKWGIIGCGNVTEIKSGCFNKIPNCELVAVMRRDALKAKDYCERHGAKRYYNTVEEILDDFEINCIYIATPPVFHKEYAIAAIRRGFHVYIEKPVALLASDAREIKIALDEWNEEHTSKVKCCVAHYRRHLKLFLDVKDIIDRKLIGDIRSCQIRTNRPKKPNEIDANSNKGNSNWRLNPKISGGGLFHDLAPHQIDILIYLFGSPVRSNGCAVCSLPHMDTKVDDLVCGTVQFQQNIVVSGSWDFNKNALDPDAYVDECTITGSCGVLMFPFFDFNKSLIALSERILEDIVCIENPSMTADTSINSEDDDGTSLSYPYKRKMNYLEVNPYHIQQPFIEQVVLYFNSSNDNCTNPCGLDDAILGMEVIDSFVR